MAKRPPADPTPPSYPPEEAFHYERAEDSDGDAIAVLVEHLSAPREFPLGEGDDHDEAPLQQAATEYLRWLQTAPIQPAPLPPAWLGALETQGDGFAWMPIEWRLPPGEPPAAVHDPFGSFHVDAGQIGEYVALFATQRAGPYFLGSGFGLRVIGRVRRIDGVRYIAFAGLSASLPGVNYPALPVPELASMAALFEERGQISALRVLIADATGLQVDTTWVRGLRVTKRKGASELEVTVTGIPLAGSVPELVSSRIRFPALTISQSVIHRTQLVADAVGDAEVFDLDPSTKSARLIRPSSDDNDLNAARVIENILGPGVLTGPLVHGTALEVWRCPRFVRQDRPFPPGLRGVTLPGTGPPVRSADASAVQAFRHARELLDRMQAYGLPPAFFFRITKPLLKAFYHSGVSPGPGKDGRSVNARVMPEGWNANAVVGPINPANRPGIELHLSLADRIRRARGRWLPGAPPEPAVPLGIGADKRWMWHEFGHALLVGATCELELRFAHSPGDALAAIVCDPDSALPAALRGATFPFVHLARQHDRHTADGWSWCGALHADLAAVPASQQPRRKGYRSEQILSSSLFRLYRALGGDTLLPNGQPDRPARRCASHYAVYLVMKAIMLLGDARVNPAHVPGQFVFALQKADWTTWLWAPGAPVNCQRIGGTAIKAIRWAFEAQGLYGAPGTNGPGQAPAVDLFIDDLRFGQDVLPFDRPPCGRGSYLPVSLDWGGAQPPKWHADRNTGLIWNAGAGTLHVVVGNRGQVTATQVTVNAWIAPWPAGAPAPDWQGGAGPWQPMQVALAGAQSVPPGGQVAFGPFRPIGAGVGRHLVLAAAECVADQSNVDPVTGPACAFLSTPLPELVANDNNLGLLVIHL